MAKILLRGISTPIYVHESRDQVLSVIDANRPIDMQGGNPDLPVPPGIFATFTIPLMIPPFTGRRLGSIELAEIAAVFDGSPTSDEVPLESCL